jgi:hypothetical protein
MEIIDIGLDSLEPISLDFNDSKPSVSFGGGIELLMNDKKRSASTMNLNLGELDNLENELNEISGNGSYSSGGGGSGTKTLSGLANSFFGGGFTPSEPAKEVSINIEPESTDSNLGQATRESAGSTKTWDGFSKLNEVPVSSSMSSSKMTDREKRRKKRAMIKKLDDWYEKGLTKHNSHFNMDSTYEEVEDEYEQAMEDKRRKDGVKLYGHWLTTFVNTLEYGNAIFNPFDLNLDGWGEQVSENMDDYDEIFTELHEKYKGGKLAPEISLILRLGFSAAVLNFSNKALSTATPGFQDVMKQNPELMRMFTNATVSSMSQASPGFAMANNFMQQEPTRPRGPPPPAPVETKSQAPPQRAGAGMMFTETPANRPDIQSGRGPMFREQGVDMNSGFARVDEESRSLRPNTQAPPPAPMATQATRPEMRGPQNSDIDNILSGLKTRTVNIHEQQPAADEQQTLREDDSMISISSLKDLQNGNMPKRTNRRRNGSARNTISLDI